MMLIDVRGLKKTYVTYRRGTTVADVLGSIFHRQAVRVEALKGIDFSIDQGELVGFLGPNGAGKSTTLKILSGVLFPTAGEARVMGFTPWKERMRYVGRIGAVFGQKSQLIWDIPPVDSFLMNRAIYRIPDAQYGPTLERLTDMLGISAVMRQPTRNLSLGERMRCEFVMAMLHGPRVVFLDEPTIGLDVMAKEAIHTFITEMNRQGVTFILTTHDLDDIERLARRVIVINTGEIVFDDSLQALRRSSGNKKKLTLVTERDQRGMEAPGVVLIERRTPLDGVYQLDLDVVDLDSFIAGVSGTRRITDMSIEEPPIENVIKELYRRR
ncbi:MAG TPA: ATP-binding cassette domain-containing protein [Spirochaetia bacterium]|nr:ATP-binding cassette domain-containing protein [Spirochaetia bacterium]